MKSRNLLSLSSVLFFPKIKQSSFTAGAFNRPVRPNRIIGPKSLNLRLFSSAKFAKKLVKYAARAGANAIKFQTFDAEELVSRNAKKMSHQAKVSKKLSQLELLQRLELSYKDHIVLKKYCKKLRWLNQIKLKIFIT